MQRQRIAVVGSGISGLSAAWLLSQRHDVVLFESADRPGGHSNTVVAEGAWGACPVDTGFIVYNTGSYPNLVALFAHLGVETARSNMSFAVSLDEGGYEYSGTGLSGIFGQPANLANPRHWRLLLDVRRFFREARQALDEPALAATSLEDFLRARQYSQAFIDRHIVPMAAAIWSSSSRDVLSFPALTFVRFFANHGLLQVKGRPEWRTVVGGSRSYVTKLLEAFRGELRLASRVEEVRRNRSGVHVACTGGPVEVFDACVLATHADTTRTLLADADDAERQHLAAFRYQPNAAILHTDARHMPVRRRIWSSWNVLDDGGMRGDPPRVTYWMNRLQPLATSQWFFVSLNPSRPIADGAELARFSYDHPVFDQAAIAAQSRLWSLQGRRRTWFCGAYFGYGFHEDGLQSGLAVAEQLGGVRRPWHVANESSRLQLADPVMHMPHEAAA